MEPFDGIASAFARLLGTTPDAAGWFLGFVVVIVLIFAFLLVLDKGEMEVGYLAGGVAVAFVVGIGWWDVWAVIFIALLVVLAILKPFSSSSGG